MGSCHQTALRMSAHAEGELRGVRRWRVPGPAAGCARGRAMCDPLRPPRARRRAGGGLEPPPRPELADRVVARIRREGGPG